MRFHFRCCCCPMAGLAAAVVLVSSALGEEIYGPLPYGQGRFAASSFWEPSLAEPSGLTPTPVTPEVVEPVLNSGLPGPIWWRPPVLPQPMPAPKTVNEDLGTSGTTISPIVVEGEGTLDMYASTPSTGDPTLLNPQNFVLNYSDNGVLSDAVSNLVSNAYTGGTDVFIGTAVASNSGSIPVGDVVTVGADGILNIGSAASTSAVPITAAGPVAGLTFSPVAFASVPEPDTLVTLAIAGGAAWFLRRRRS